MITIRHAIAEDAQALTRLMRASAAYRGRYAMILDGYTVTTSQIEQDVFHVAEKNGEVCGFYSLVLEGEPELDLMFVADSLQGSGLGSTLFQHMKGEAKRRASPPSRSFLIRRQSASTKRWARSSSARSPRQSRRHGAGQF